ncbi:MAG: transposase [Betaproteobacteria bacterium]|nr:transposase [Betaproteobacteria bacterium]
MSPNSSPEAARHVIEALAEVYKHDATCRTDALSAEQRLSFHQQHSRPVMDGLERWMAEQFDKRLVEPNSGLGKALRYLIRHWDELTLFLREAGAPLDNNLCEQIPEARDIAAQGVPVLQDGARCAGRRHLHEPDPHLHAVRCQPVRLSERASAARSGGDRRAGALAAVELPRTARRWSVSCAVQPIRPQAARLSGRHAGAV